MDLNVAQKIIQNHLLEGKMQPGEEIGLKVDQVTVQNKNLSIPLTHSLSKRQLEILKAGGLINSIRKHHI